MARRVPRASLDAWLRDVERLLETKERDRERDLKRVEQRQGDAA